MQENVDFSLRKGFSSCRHIRARKILQNRAHDYAGKTHRFGMDARQDIKLSASRAGQRFPSKHVSPRSRTAAQRSKNTGDKHLRK